MQMRRADADEQQTLIVELRAVLAHAVHDGVEQLGERTRAVRDQRGLDALESGTRDRLGRRLPSSRR